MPSNCQDDSFRIDDASTLITICYAGIYLLFLTGVIVYFYDKTHSFGENARFIWAKRSIYGSLVVTIFDQASDIAVLVILFEYKNARCDFNIEELIIISICSLVLTRLMNFLTITAGKGMPGHQFVWYDVILCLLDIYPLKQVVICHQKNMKEKTRLLHIILANEAIFETVPQVIIQSMFIIGTNTTKDITAVVIVMVSVTVSIISGANKLASMDKQFKSFDEALDSAEWRSHCPVINVKYLIRVVWRYCDLISRSFLIVLVWVVLDDNMLLLFFCLSFVVYAIVGNIFFFDPEYGVGFRVSLTIWLYLNANSVAMSWAPDTNENSRLHLPTLHMVCRFLENFAFYLLVTIIAFDDDIDCNGGKDRFTLCARYDKRNPEDNIYIFIYIIIGHVTLYLEVLLYFLIRNHAIIAAVGKKDEEKLQAEKRRQASTSNSDITKTTTAASGAHAGATASPVLPAAVADHASQTSLATSLSDASPSSQTDASPDTPSNSTPALPATSSTASGTPATPDFAVVNSKQ